MLKKNTRLNFGRWGARPFRTPVGGTTNVGVFVAAYLVFSFTLHDGLHFPQMFSYRCRLFLLLSSLLREIASVLSPASRSWASASPYLTIDFFCVFRFSLQLLPTSFRFSISSFPFSAPPIFFVMIYIDSFSAFYECLDAMPRGLFAACGG